MVQRSASLFIFGGWEGCCGTLSLNKDLARNQCPRWLTAEGCSRSYRSLKPGPAMPRPPPAAPRGPGCAPLTLGKPWQSLPSRSLRFLSLKWDLSHWISLSGGQGLIPCYIKPWTRSLPGPFYVYSTWDVTLLKACPAKEPSSGRIYPRLPVVGGGEGCFASFDAGGDGTMGVDRVTFLILLLASESDSYLVLTNCAPGAALSTSRINSLHPHNNPFYSRENWGP